MRNLFFLRKWVILYLIPKSKNVLVRTIKHYLSRHKRLVIPQFGAFIVKEPGGEVLFSELLRRDDGVLRGLLCGEGMSELEAAGAIDRFVFEVRHAVQEGGEYPMEGFGRFRAGRNGTMAFVHEPASDPAPGASDPAAGPANAEDAGDVPQPAAPAVPPQPERQAAAAAHVPEPPHGSKIDPDPSLKGLRYGKPRKTTDAYTYVERRARRSVDRFLWVAIIAAVVAGAAIAFGFYVSGMRAEAEAAELSVPFDTTGADGAGNVVQTPEE